MLSWRLLPLIHLRLKTSWLGDRFSNPSHLSFCNPFCFAGSAQISRGAGKLALMFCGWGGTCARIHFSLNLIMLLALDRPPNELRLETFWPPECIHIHQKRHIKPIGHSHLNLPSGNDQTFVCFKGFLMFVSMDKIGCTPSATAVHMHQQFKRQRPSSLRLPHL